MVRLSQASGTFRHIEKIESTGERVYTDASRVDWEDL